MGAIQSPLCARCGAEAEETSYIASRRICGRCRADLTADAQFVASCVDTFCRRNRKGSGGYLLKVETIRRLVGRYWFAAWTNNLRAKVEARTKIVNLVL